MYYVYIYITYCQYVGMNYYEPEKLFLLMIEKKKTDHARNEFFNNLN